MNRHRIGKTAVEVSEFALGTAPIGNLYVAVDDDTASAAIAAAWSGGVRYFDTAPHYGLGLAERRLGRALADRPRGEYALSTKVGRLLVPNPSPSGSDLKEGGFAVGDDLMRVLDYSRDGVLRSLEASLQRLALDHIDIVYVHDPQDHIDEALAGAIPALIGLREQGVVGAVGVGMNYWRPLLRFATEADIDVVMVAGRWTLADRSARPLLEQCLRGGVSVVAAAPFNSGLLAQRWPADDAHFDYGPAPAEVLARARALAAVCERAGIGLPQAALLFPLQHEAVVSVVAGARDAREVTEIMSWAANKLPDMLWDQLDVDE